MPLNIKKSGEQDKEQSKEWLMNTGPGFDQNLRIKLISSKSSLGEAVICIKNALRTSNFRVFSAKCNKGPKWPCITPLADK